MASKARKGSDCPLAVNLQGSDTLLAVATQNGVVNTYQVTVGELLTDSNVSFNTTGSNNSMSSANLVLRTNLTPTSSNSVGTQGMIRYDGGFVYVCVSNNSWKRAALTTF